MSLVCERYQLAILRLPVRDGSGRIILVERLAACPLRPFTRPQRPGTGSSGKGLSICRRRIFVLGAPEEQGEIVGKNSMVDEVS